MRRVSAAVDGVSLSIEQGAIFGLVGESGCGKSTLAQIIVRLIEPTEGKIVYRGVDVDQLKGEDKQAFRHAVQMVFQDTGSSLNPRKRIRRVLAEALKARGIGAAQAKGEIETLMHQVGLDMQLLQTFSARAFRRAAAACRHRPGARDEAGGAGRSTSLSRPSTCRCRGRSSICCRISIAPSG